MKRSQPSARSSELRKMENRILHVEDNPDDVMLMDLAFTRAVASATRSALARSVNDGDQAIAALEKRRFASRRGTSGLCAARRQTATPFRPGGARLDSQPAALAAIAGDFADVLRPDGGHQPRVRFGREFFFGQTAGFGFIDAIGQDGRALLGANERAAGGECVNDALA